MLLGKLVIGYLVFNGVKSVAAQQMLRHSDQIIAWGEQQLARLIVKGDPRSKDFETALQTFKDGIAKVEAARAS